MMAIPLTRRRFIGVTAAAAGLGLASLGRPAHAEAHLVTWRGRAMGADAVLQIHHRDPAIAQRLIESAVTEVRHLERIFSLHRNDSALAELNRLGILPAPPPELVDLLVASRRYFERTGGAFDPTVQALWVLYRDHFSKPGADPQGPSEAARLSALARVGFSRVTFDENRVVLTRRGMALTFNGIAQGYATDRIVEMLRSNGIERSLVDMGEPRASGRHPSGHPWKVGIADPDQPDRICESLDITDGAVATSGGYGFWFDRDGRFNHLFDPQTGRSAARYKSVTVVMPTATAADALSTAFSLMREEAVATVLRGVGGRAHIVKSSGERVVFGID